MSLKASPYPALSVVVVRDEVRGRWSPQQGGDYWLCGFNVRLCPEVFAALFVCGSLSSYILDNALSKRLLLCQQWV